MLRLTIIEEPDGETPESATLVVGPGGAGAATAQQPTISVIVLPTSPLSPQLPGTVNQG